MSQLNSLAKITRGRTALIILAALAGPSATWGAAAAASSPLPFNKATVSEAVGDVTMQDVSAGPAKQPVKANDEFNAPNMLYTGTKSRAQLTAADGTVARVGSNSIFSFEPNSRSINLKQGSVLFNSPSGKGGGTISTNSATATVLGTTLIVTATSDGGFKVMMMEGSGDVKLPDGSTVHLTAGQMTFIMPGALKPDGTRETPKAGPVVNFDLAKQQAGSDLVHGFTLVLPSQDKLDSATSDQQAKIANGDLVKTDKLVIGAVSKNEIVIGDLSTISTASNANPNNPNNTPDNNGPTVADALQAIAALGSGASIPSNLTFTTPVVFTAADLGLPGGLIPNDQIVVTGIIAGKLVISGRVDLGAFDGLKAMTIFAGDQVTFSNSSQFAGLNKTTVLNIFAEDIVFSPATTAQTIVANFGGTGPTAFNVNDIGGMTLNLVTLSNPTGSLDLASVLGDMSLTGSSVLAGSGNASVRTGGSLALTSSYVSAANGAAILLAAGDVTMQDTIIEATQGTNPGAGIVNIQSGGVLSIQGGALLGQKINVTGGDSLTVNNTNFSSTAQSISMGARTLNLYNVNFPGATVVNLSSSLGMLAPHPNTNQAGQAGYVNFISNVNYNGSPAQKFIPISKGGTGEFPTRINIKSF